MVYEFKYIISILLICAISGPVFSTLTNLSKLKKNCCANKLAKLKYCYYYIMYQYIY